MSFEIPKTRSEKILQNILGAKNEIEPIQSRIEAILFAILNDTEIGDPYTAPARCEIEKLLVAIKDGGEYDETPLTRSGQILLCKLRGEDYTGTTQSRLEKLFLRWLYELMEITDVPPFTFNSKGNNLIDYDIYGAEDGVGNYKDVTVSGNPISVSDAVEASAESLQVAFTPTQDGTPSIDSEPTTEPYLSKVIPRGNKEYYSLVGGTVAWNQLVDKSKFATYTADGGNVVVTPNNDGSITVAINNDLSGRVDIYFTANIGTSFIKIPPNHVFALCDFVNSRHGDFRNGINYANLGWNRLRKVSSEYTIYLGFTLDATTTAGTYTITPQLIDLTLLFANNPAIADYAYSLEQSEVGSGIAWLKSYGFFTKDYYPYNPGELISVNTSGHKIGSTTYPIDPTDLRGLFSLDVDNKLYCEGDIYPPSGNMSRKYTIVEYDGSSDESWNIEAISTISEHNFYIPTTPSGKQGIWSSNKFVSYAIAFGNIVQGKQNVFISVSHNLNYYPGQDFSSVADFKTWLASNPIQVLYELATPTTESATPYTSPIPIEAGGTEEFIDNRTVPMPVGNETYYASEYAVHGKTSVTVSHGATSSDTPTEYTVEFTQQGTVYGGTVDIVSGVLSVNYGTLNLGTTTWTYAPTGYAVPLFYANPGITGKAFGKTNFMLSKYKAFDSPSWGAIPKGCASGSSTSNRIAIHDERYSSVQNFKDSLNGTILVYELASPLTYQLTTQQVQMLLNNNYLTTPDGTITLTYKDHNIEVPFSVSCGVESNSYKVGLSDKLYKVGAYADSISYDDQTVKREIIVEHLTGTEEWVLNDGVFSTALGVVARTPAVLCNELTTDQCYISEDLTTLNVTGVSQTSVEEFTSWLQANDVYVQYVREQTLVTSHTVPEVSTFNGTNTFSVDTDVTPSEVTIIYPNRVTTTTLPKTKKIGKSKLTKSK